VVESVQDALRGYLTAVAPTVNDVIEVREGVRQKTYPDVAGFPAIGYGHLLKPGGYYPNGITIARALLLLLADLG
jgi:GH24 family phage-related lysozyme (muramidase)